MFQFILIPLFAWAAKQDLTSGRVDDWLAWLCFLFSAILNIIANNSYISFFPGAFTICCTCLAVAGGLLGPADVFFLSSIVFLFGPEVLLTVGFSTIIYVAIAYFFNLQKSGEKLHAIPIFLLAYLIQAVSFFLAFFWH